MGRDGRWRAMVGKWVGLVGGEGILLILCLWLVKYQTGVGNDSLVVTKQILKNLLHLPYIDITFLGSKEKSRR
mgnify:CR=1 FL=1